MALEELQHRDDFVVHRALAEPLLVAVRHEIQHVLARCVFDKLALVGCPQERVEGEAVG